MKTKVTLEQILAAVESDDYIGICLACGEEQGGCEPDAREYECESCGQRKVYGAEELLNHAQSGDVERIYAFEWAKYQEYLKWTETCGFSVQVLPFDRLKS